VEEIKEKCETKRACLENKGARNGSKYLRTQE